jgi:hypothetical protein
MIFYMAVGHFPLSEICLIYIVFYTLAFLSPLSDCYTDIFLFLMLGQ